MNGAARVTLLNEDQRATYLDRIGLNASPSVDPAGLAVLQRAHCGAIPFENLDIRLGRGVSLDPEAVFAKLVVAKRGGYGQGSGATISSAALDSGVRLRLR